MQRLLDVFARSGQFIRNNPQIIYTIFLLVAIPLAFFFTSEQFLRVASENQNRLERSRIGLMQDVFAIFASPHLEDASYLNEQIRQLAEGNETIVTFQILGEGSGGRDEEFPILASLDPSDRGQKTSPDQLTGTLLDLASGNTDQAFAGEYFSGGWRYWRSVRAITATSTHRVAGYVVTDLSMAQVDNIARRNIRNAYVVLAVIILLIIILLARQAKIIDYAALYQRLKEVDRMKDDFVSMAAHELRSPLTIIRGYTDMLRDEKLSEDGRGHLASVERSAGQLNMLIGDILDVAKLQEGRMSFNYETKDVSEELSAIVESFMKPAQDKGLQLAYERKTLPPITIDQTRFHQVMINLVGNAIKYTPKGEVRVITGSESGKVIIRVSDTGMGISADDQQKLFQKFYRVKTEETQKITGTGLGLWITAQLVKAMGGSISVESIKGKGTDFIVTFPVAKQ